MQDKTLGSRKREKAHSVPNCSILAHQTIELKLWIDWWTSFIFLISKINDAASENSILDVVESSRTRSCRKNSTSLRTWNMRMPFGHFNFEQLQNEAVGKGSWGFRLLLLLLLLLLLKPDMIQARTTTTGIFPGNVGMENSFLILPYWCAGGKLDVNFLKRRRCQDNNTA